jgi:hypothetical protein
MLSSEKSSMHGVMGTAPKPGIPSCGATKEVDEERKARRVGKRMCYVSSRSKGGKVGGYPRHRLRYAAPERNV